MCVLLLRPLQGVRPAVCTIRAPATLAFVPCSVVDLVAVADDILGPQRSHVSSLASCVVPSPSLPVALVSALVDAAHTPQAGASRARASWAVTSTVGATTASVSLGQAQLLTMSGPSQISC